MFISERLRDARIEAGLTQQQLADEAGIERTTISRIEGGRAAQYETAVALFGALGLDIELVVRKSEKGA